MNFKKAFKFYINSSLHVALAVVAFTMITCLNFHIPFNPELLLFIFFATVTGYNFLKYAPLGKLGHFGLSKSLRSIQVFSFLCFLILIITLFFQSFEVLLAAGIFGIITLLYALPILGRHRNLRGIPGLKIYIIAIVVAGVTVVFPLLDTPAFPSRDHIIEFFQRFLIAVVLILPFEIRDMHTDKIHLRTLPQRLGVSKSKMIGVILTLFFCTMEIIKKDIYIPYTLSVMFLGILSIFFLKKATIDQSDYFASFWVEAAPVFWLGIFYLMQRII